MLTVVQFINFVIILVSFNTIIHSYPFSYTLTRAVLIFQLIWVMLGQYIFYRRKIRGLEYVLLFLLPLLLLQYVVEGYSSGFAVLPLDIQVLPRMRASVAYEMLHDLGYLYPQLDPHLAYPQEFMILHILRLITSRPIIELYEGVMKTVSLIFWIIFVMLLHEYTKNILKDARYSSFEYFLVRLTASLLLTFPPGYSGEMSYAYPSLALIFYLLLNRSNYSRNLLLLVMLSLGVILGSQRETLTLLVFTVTALMFFILHKYTKASIMYMIISILTLLQLLYNAQLYVAEYKNYLQGLLRVLDEIVRGEVYVRRPPLHTVLALRFPVDRWLNTVGSTAFLTTLILSGSIGLMTFALYIHSLIKKKMRADAYSSNVEPIIVELSIVVTFLVFSFIIAVQYVANIFGLWTIDFESIIPLIRPTILFIPLIGVKIFKYRLRSGGSKFKGSSKGNRSQSLFSLLLTLMTFYTLLSPLGLALRTDVRGYIDVVDARGDPTELTILANNVYNFLLRYGFSPQTVVLDSRFSGHYLYLPLKYKGFNVVVCDYCHQAVTRDVNALKFSTIVLNNGNFILYFKNNDNVIHIYDGEHVIMPY